MRIVVYGMPAPQGSKRHVGRGVMIESSKKVKPWREAVKYAALAVDGCVAGPVDVEMVFTMPKPKSAPKNRRAWADRMPDLSKLVRSTEDALTDAGKWEDDARIVRCVSSKVFPGDACSLHIPGATIRITSAMDSGAVPGGASNGN